MKGSQLEYHSTPIPRSQTNPGLTVVSLKPSDHDEDFSDYSADVLLVQRCLAGEQEAWSEFVKTYRGLVYKIASRFGAGYHDSADIFQAVCIEAFNSLSHLRNAELLRAWLITLTVRQAFQCRKKQSNHVALDDIDPVDAVAASVVPDIDEKLWRKQKARLIRESVGQLPARSAEMVRLLFFEQPPLPYEEVARRLCLATGSIGFIRGRALTKLRKILADAGCDGT
jgi:RNA polymerase sigma factor (sigma-70 family)